jgi:hypothetical protein
MSGKELFDCEARPYPTIKDGGKEVPKIIFKENYSCVNKNRMKERLAIWSMSSVTLTGNLPQNNWLMCSE